VSGDRLLATVARQGWAWLTVLGVTAIAGTIAQLLLPAALGRAVDAAIAGTAALTGTGSIFRNGTGGWLVACAGLVAVIACAEVTAELATGFSGAAASARLREMLAAHMLAAGARLARGGALGGPGGTGSTSSAGGTFSPGDTVSRLVGGAVDAGAGPASVVTAVTAAVLPVGSVVALGLIDPWLAVAFLAGFPVLALTMSRLARDAATIGTGYGQAQGAIAARLLDALAGARTIAAAGTQCRERRRILVPLPVLRDHGYASWRVQARAAAQGMLIAPLLQVIVVAVAGIELARHRITPGDLLAASQYAMLAVGIGASTSMVARLGRARGGARRAAGLLAVPLPRYGAAVLPASAPATAGSPQSPPGRGCPGELRLRGVTARRGGETILDDLSLTVPAGACVALVGKSGAGKSTLAELAGRLADPDEGTVTLDATDLRDLTRTSLRASVVYAFARPHLFGRTPREAIGFGSGPPPPPHVVAAAAEDGQAASFIARLPRNYDTPLDDTSPSSEAPSTQAPSTQAPSTQAPSTQAPSREAPSWATLSGGEAQRIGLARAFAHAAAARLLILDDATSSLDTVTEMLVSQAITGRLAGRTRLIVAHRAATAARADLVAWLADGRIRALAPHERLWGDPDYRALFGAC
jgi:ATP-binding cassette subfamily B protein